MKPIRQNVLSGIGVILILIFATATGSKTTQEALKAPAFSYSPPSTATEQQADMTIAIIAPQYSNIRVGGEPFRSFAASLEGETMEVLTTKGYSVRGPFKSRDDMVYSDKEACAFAILMDIQLSAGKVSGDWEKVKMADGSMGYKFKKGQIALFGTINLTAMEPMTGEKMWAKSISIPQNTTREFSSSLIYTGNADQVIDILAAYIGNGDANVSNPMTEALEKSFEDIMSQVWRHLDPQEFERMMPKIKKLKGM